MDPAVRSTAEPPAKREHQTGVSYWPIDGDRKSTRLNSSHSSISYAVFCLKKKKKKQTPQAKRHITIPTHNTLDQAPPATPAPHTCHPQHAHPLHQLKRKTRPHSDPVILER